jgi:hypothetical protein
MRGCSSSALPNVASRGQFHAVRLAECGQLAQAVQARAADSTYGLKLADSVLRNHQHVIRLDQDVLLILRVTSVS